MAWLALIVSGGLEVVWSTALKLSDGLTRPGWIAVMIPAMVAGFWLLAYAMRGIDLGTAYPVWVGIGAVGAVLVGALWLGEALTPLRIASVGLILAGIAGLRIAG
ncbi:DMT family transporter [Rhodosalinus sp.]|uniref:DMT family transporter n=1 Tax=Rhodosalinus sp. TaxID=2047741 RepID=UPI00356AF7C0